MQAALAQFTWYHHIALMDDVANPWYADDFEATWRDVLEGCQGLLRDKAHVDFPQKCAIISIESCVIKTI